MRQKTSEKGRLPFQLKKNSIMMKVLVPMIAVLIVQSFVIIASIYFGGVFRNLEDSALELLEQKAQSRVAYINDNYFNKWTNIAEYYKSINLNTQVKMREYGVSCDNINNTDDKNLDAFRTDLFSKIDKTLIEIIRNNSVTGAYVLYVGDDVNYRYGLYIRDDDPTLNAYDNSDLSLQVAPNTYSQQTAIKPAGTHLETFDFTNYSESNKNFYFYTNPIRAANHRFSSGETNVADIKNLAYTGSPIYMNRLKECNVMTYSLPLIDANNVVYGILGVELDVPFLQKILPETELDPLSKSAYVFTLKNAQTSFNDIILTNGSFYASFIGDFAVKDFTAVKANPKFDAAYEIITPQNDRAVVVSYDIRIHNRGTLFENDVLMLVAIIDRDTLYATSDSISTLLFVVAAIAISICLAIVFMISAYVARPVSNIAKQIRTSNVSEDLSFTKTNIAEIDEVTGAIEKLNHEIIESSFKTEQIIKLLDMQIASFETDVETDRVYYSPYMFDLFNVPHRNRLTRAQFDDFIRSFNQYITLDNPEFGNRIYHLTNENPEKWLLMKYTQTGSKMIGIVRDTTDETLEKIRLEKERNYDGLTNLLNRRAFFEQTGDLSPEDLKCAAFVMMDLDNLKYINDNYGHDFGDTYIITIANILKEFADEHQKVIVSRMAGDEFFLCLYGFKNQQEGKESITLLKNKLATAKFQLSDGSSFKARASAGVSWYPQNSTDMDELLKYADYAMYEAKTTVKGDFKNFNYSTYIKGEDLLKKREDLNSLIDNRAIYFKFQPIVDVPTGKILGYEALMRSRLQSFSSPIEIIGAARMQFKLNKIEQLTLFESLSEYSKKVENLTDIPKIFINSISNQVLPPQEIRQIENLYPNLLQHIVLEFTESERLNDLFTKQKKGYIRKWNAQIALDDFATGFNSETVLLELCPHYVKVDIGIIRGIDRDENRQMIVSNLVNIGRNLGIKIIGEGIETKAELQTVIALGIDYVQGFYVGMPTEQLAPLDKSISEQIRQMKLDADNSEFRFPPPSNNIRKLP